MPKLGSCSEVCVSVAYQVPLIAIWRKTLFARGKHFACAAFVRTTVVPIIPSPLQRLHGFGYNGIVRIHLSTWLVLQLEGSVHSVPRDVTLPSLDRLSAVTTSSTLDRETAGLLRVRDNKGTITYTVQWRLQRAQVLQLLGTAAQRDPMD